MLLPALFLALAITIQCQPLRDPMLPDNFRQTETSVNVISYIQNFKQIMTDYISKHHRNLTDQEKDTVKHILEDFLKNFAKDLDEAIKIQNEEIDGVKPKPGTASTQVTVDAYRSKVSITKTELKTNETNPTDYVNVHLEVSDGIVNDSFDMVKNKLKESMPDIKDEVSDIIINSLKRNVAITRERLKKVLKKDDVVYDEVDLD